MSALWWRKPFRSPSATNMSCASLHLCFPAPRQLARRSRSRCCTASAAPTSDSSARAAPVLPTSAAAQVRQCAAAVNAALKDGVTVQRVTLELPLIGATDLDDWPGGTRQQLQAAAPLVSQLLTELGGVSVPVARSDVDASDGVVLFTSATHRVVTFVTADTLGDVQALCNRDSGCLLLVNAEWKDSDFGWGLLVNRQLLGFANSLEETFAVRRMRIRGQDLRVVRAYPSEHAVYALGLDGQRDLVECIGVTPQRPTYAQIEAMLGALGKRSISNADISTRLKSEFAFNKDSANNF